MTLHQAETELRMADIRAECDAFVHARHLLSEAAITLGDAVRAEHRVAT